MKYSPLPNFSNLDIFITETSIFSNPYSLNTPYQAPHAYPDTARGREPSPPRGKPGVSPENPPVPHRY